MRKICMLKFRRITRRVGLLWKSIDRRILSPRGYILTSCEFPDSAALNTPYRNAVRLLRLGCPVLLELRSRRTKSGQSKILGYYWIMLSTSQEGRTPQLKYCKTTLSDFLKVFPSLPCTL